MGNAQDGDVVRLLGDGALELGVDGGSLDGGAEEDAAVVAVDDAEESLHVVGDAGGLVERGDDVALVVLLELVELHDVEVVEDDVGAEDSLLHVCRLGGELADAVVGEGEDGDGLAAVDLGDEAGGGEEGVEGAEVGVLVEDAGDVMGGGGGGEEEDHGGDGEENGGAGGGTHFGRRLRYIYI